MFKKKDDPIDREYRIPNYGVGWDGFKRWVRCGGDVCVALEIAAICGLALLCSAGDSKYEIKRQNLINKVTIAADANENGTLDPVEIGNIYKILDKPFYEVLTFTDMELYLKKTK